MGRPSLTARHVAWQRAALDRPATSDAGAVAEQRLAESVAGWLRPLRSHGVPMAARTRFFDQQVLDAIDRGVGQIVIVGAGYDGRALRFADPGVVFYEVDREVTQADKRLRLARLGIEEDATRFVVCDLSRDDAAAALRVAGADPEAASLVLCEGLLPYITAGDAERMLRAVRAVVGPGSTLAVNFLVRPPVPSMRIRAAQALADLALLVIRERRRNDFAPGDPEALLSSSGWVIERTERGDTDIGPAHGLLVEASLAPTDQ